LACTFASANQNEQKHSLNMLKKTELILKRFAARLRSVIADSQYSDGKLRDTVDDAVIPYRASQKSDIKGLLRVDKKFRTYGPEARKGSTKKTTHRAARQLPEDKVQSKGQQGKRLRQRSFARAPQHSLLGSEPRGSRKHGKIDKAVSSTHFNK